MSNLWFLKIAILLSNRYTVNNDGTSLTILSKEILILY